MLAPVTAGRPRGTTQEYEVQQSLAVIISGQQEVSRRPQGMISLVDRAVISWRTRCSWCGDLFNSGNCRHCTNVSFEDEPVYDSNPYSYNQTPDFSNPLPHHNYETDSGSDTGAAFQAEFAKLQQNFERFMAQQSCSYCGGPLTVEIVQVVAL
ncbi:hypothetical protein Tco_1216227 [Tanacetum coccineum]